ncbi:hypothetical protein G5B30_00900 [Sphingobacterium sp. SGG-5]|uniref:hypothetical protein n=1 Tax=Sphingobacterium sp. SGG-5 TaxID=2710881 RepID=UPI0013EC852E|nr:hypothetical protein [Sphingobacterium sp. SGG-5]NGM60462.1 hypothetical protein [Sphingobacterium sp. SGG-5]
MWKLVTYTFLISCACAYIIITRQHFYNLFHYASSGLFRTMFIITVPLLWVYMFFSNMSYNIFLGYRPRPLHKWKKKSGAIAYFLIGFLIISCLHIGMLELLFEMHGQTVWSSGYLHGDVFFFAAIVWGYHFMIYKKPHWAVFNRLIWNLFKGGLIWAQNNAGKGEDESYEEDNELAEMTILSAEEPGEAYGREELPGGTERRIQVFNILLLHFSKSEGTYFIDTQGNRTYCRCTSSVLKSWEVSPWFVKVNRKVYLNMWYFAESRDMPGAVLLEEVVARKIAKGVQEQELDLRELTEVSVRCRPNVKQHFKERDRLATEGWGKYFYYD